VNLIEGNRGGDVIDFLDHLTDDDSPPPEVHAARDA
jgi:hypothetical protein